MHWGLIAATGLVFGFGAVILVALGNPGNYGFCAACQLRDIAGALGIHSAAALQYVRPEIMGFILGAFVLSKSRGQFKSRGGSKPLVRFFLGMAMMVGALVFLGCPLRGILRLAGGDLNALSGMAGFISGVGAGVVFLRNGYNLGRSRIYQGGKTNFGYLAVAASLVLLIALTANAGFLNFSKSGPGSMHAPVLASLFAGLLAGVLAGKSRMCLSGGVRDYILFRDTGFLKIYGVMFLAALLANMYFGSFKLGFTGQPLSHSMHLWNFLGLFLTGLAACLAGGCPLRQLIASGEGNTDAMWSVLGMLAGAGVSHGLNAAGSAAGVAIAGQIAVITGIFAVVGIGVAFRASFGAVTVKEGA